MTTNSEQEQRKRNDQALRAWKEWKKKCSVDACNPENRRILTGEVTRAFNRELVKALKMARIISPRENEARWRKSANECVTEFDCAIIEADTERVNKQTGALRKRKKWKNVVWRKMNTSQDAPLKVLRGQLTGPASFMRDVVREYVQREYQKDTMSLNELLGGSEEADGATLEDRLLDPSSAFDLYLEPSQLNDETQDDEKQNDETQNDETQDDETQDDETQDDEKQNDERQSPLEASLDAAFTLPDMVLVLAKAHRVALSDVLLHFPMGLGLSAVYDRQKQALTRLGTWFDDWAEHYQDKQTSAVVLQHFFSRLSAENLPKALLYLLDPQKG